MSIDFSKALGIHPDALKLRGERTKVLASNIANENTPGYQARDIDFSAALRSMHSGESEGVGIATGEFAEAALKYRVPYHSSKDLNTVELSVEQAAFSENASAFQASLTFVNLKLKGLAKAIGGQ